MQYLHIYLGVVSVIAIILILHDKHTAKKQNWRVKERTLLIVSALGGSAAMLLMLFDMQNTKSRNGREKSKKLLNVLRNCVK